MNGYKKNVKGNLDAEIPKSNEGKKSSSKKLCLDFYKRDGLKT